MSMHIAYFVNQHPKVSHSFIRREMLALERPGIEVQRIARSAGPGSTYHCAYATRTLLPIEE